MALVYYLPGWSGELDKGLGSALMARGLDVAGRETRGEFKNLTFTEQVAVVRDDLVEHFWTSESLVVAVSFGAYLFLHAQLALPSFPGKVLLLSPIIGGFADEQTGRVFCPPQQDKLFDAARASNFPKLPRCEVHTGSEDWQSHPDAVVPFFKSVGVETQLADGLGHSLGSGYVGKVLEVWLGSKIKADSA